MLNIQRWDSPDVNSIVSSRKSIWNHCFHLVPWDFINNFQKTNTTQHNFRKQPYSICNSRHPLNLHMALTRGTYLLIRSAMICLVPLPICWTSSNTQRNHIPTKNPYTYKGISILERRCSKIGRDRRNVQIKYPNFKLIPSP